MARNFAGITWMFSKLLAFCLEKYCDSKPEKKTLRKGFKKRTWGYSWQPFPSPHHHHHVHSHAICCPHVRGELRVCWCNSGRKRTWKSFVMEQMYFTSACPGDGNGGLQVRLGLEYQVATGWCLSPSQTLTHLGFVTHCGNEMYC